MNNQVQILESHAPESVGLAIRDENPGFVVLDLTGEIIIAGPLTKRPFIATILTKGESRLAAVSPDAQTAYLL
jgi:hypothetical protein